MNLESSQATLIPPQRGQKTLSQVVRIREPRKTLRLPVRVIYTFNSSTQYLLARPRVKVQVIPICGDEDNKHESSTKPTADAGAERKYAKMALKTCLEAVCSSSPELVSDRSRDYSVYVLDPLESSPKDCSVSHGLASSSADQLTSSGGPSCSWGDGVSIGMGLMSWCLSEDPNNAAGSESDDDEGYVIGTMVKDRGSNALEVVMTLRETAPQTQRQHALSLSSWGIQAVPSLSNSEHSVQDAGQVPSHIHKSLSPSPSSNFSTSQPSTVSTSPDNEWLSELDETSILQAPGSSTLDVKPNSNQPSNQSSSSRAATNKRGGRPPGTRTHPEKKARRLAIQSHKEKLEVLVNISKMQKGEEYDKTLIPFSENTRPKVTDEDITRQQQLLEELASRPLIVDQPLGRCLTTEPLPNRATSPIAALPPSKKAASRRKARSAASSNALASGSGAKTDQRTGETGEMASPAVSTIGPTGDQRGIDLLFSLLTSVLGNVDEPLLAQEVAVTRKETDKGKAKEAPLHDALAGALKQLLPLLPNNPAQLGGQSHPSGQSAISIPNSTAGSTNYHRQLQSLPPQLPHKPPRLFKTAEEAFYSEPARHRNWLEGGQLVAERSVTPEAGVPKVRDDAHPVPGGGWARGRNLVPRVATPQHTSAPAEAHVADSVADTATYPITPTARPDKENMPPAQPKRGLKRGLSCAVNANEKGASSEAVSSRTNAKKRRQEVTFAVSRNASRSKGTKHSVRGSAETNKASASTGFGFAASSPVRSIGSTSATQNLPVMAMSEPDTQPPRLAETLAVTTTPGVPAIEPPRTPPRRDKPLDVDADGSLFTPCAPDEPTSRLTLPRSSVPLFSASPRHVNSRGSHVGDASQTSTATGDIECQGGALGSRHVITGWDLPPSSPPPPTSPISPNIEVGADENDQMDFEFAMQLQSELSIKMEKVGTDGRFEDQGATINSDGCSTPVSGMHHSLDENGSPDQIAFGTSSSAPDFEPSSDFHFDELAQLEQGPDTLEGIALDIEELWGSLGPVIAQAQTCPSLASNGQTSPQTDLGFLFDQTHVDTEGQGGVDPVKLAEDLKALFGGCVV